MKISKFNESSEFDKMMDEKFPIKCKIKNRTPDPGICWVIKINFEEKNVEWSNGYVRSTIYGFDNVEFIPDLFIYSKYNL